MLISEFLGSLFCFDEAGGDGGTGSSGANDGAGGDGDNSNDNSNDGDDGAGGDGKAGTVPREQFDRLLRQRKEDRAQLEELLADKKKREDADLEKKGDQEKRIQQRDEEIAKLNTKIASFQEAFVEGKKESALRKAIGKALDPKWDTLVRHFTEQVAVDKDGNIDQKMATKIASDFTTQYPEAFGEIKDPKTPNPKGGAKGGKITREEYRNMPTSTPEELAAKKAAMANVED